MNERRLYFISIAVSLIGLLILLLVPETPDSYFQAAQECYNDFEIKGKVTAVQEKGTIGIISLEQNVTIVAFQKLSPDIVGKNARITARLSEYKGKQEIIAEEIKST
ncbi:MAG: hypothetical protein V1702_02195 [Candidatus Woesearchaeota archaeon]